jgi:hypothetical protein
MIGPATSGVESPSSEALNANSGSLMISSSPTPNGYPAPPSVQKRPRAP